MPQSVTTPWGKWEVLADSHGYKVKRITVNQGHRLSYQKHSRRSEHWFIVSGTATLTLNGSEMELKPGGHMDIPCGSAHRVASRGSEAVVFIEVQTGSCCEEDDIIRLEDDYGRTHG